MSNAATRYDIQVKGMSCQHCVKAVTQAVHAHDADAQVTIDLPAGQVSVVSKLGRDAIVAAIVEEGYEALL